MLIGTVLISVFISMAAVIASITMSMPLWVTLAIYTATGCTALLLSALFWAARNGRPGGDVSYARLQPITDTQLSWTRVSPDH